MPPKQKVRKIDIVEAVFMLAKKDGFERVNARSLATELGCSTQPIFSVFRNMNELKDVLYLYASDYFDEYLRKQVDKENVLFSLGRAYIQFAKKERHLFQMLFLRNEVTQNSFLEICEEFLEKSGTKNADVPEGQTDEQKIYLRAWIYFHGIAAMVSVNDIELYDEEIENLIGEAILSFTMLIGQQKK